MTEKRVLCVDDNKQMCDIVTQLLNPFTVVSANDIGEALEIAASGKFDLFIVDIHLPDGVGTDLVSELRKEHPDTPAILITTAPDLSMEEIRDIGAVSLLDKVSSTFVSDLLRISGSFLSASSSPAIYLD